MGGTADIWEEEARELPKVFSAGKRIFNEGVGGADCDALGARVLRPLRGGLDEADRILDRLA